MQFIDLKTQYLRLKDEIDAGIRDVLDHTAFIMGDKVAALEERLGAFCGAKHAISCSSGTDALLMPLMAWGIGPGDAVFVPTFSFFATAEVVGLVGATPIFVDISPDTYNMDPEALRAAIQRVRAQGVLKLRAVIPVDLFGHSADYDALTPLAREHGLLLLEDAAQAFGATYHGKRVGSFGDAAATSFFPAKPLGCYGDGGAVFTDDDQTAALLRSIRVHGQGTDKYDNERLGINGRLDAMQAVVLLAKLGVFEEEIARRNEVAQAYDQQLSGAVVTPTVREGCMSTWAQYSVLCRDSAHRERVRAALQSKGIPSMVYYAIPLHMQKAFAALGGRRGQCPVAEDASDRILSLPMHAYLRDNEIQQIADAVLSAG